MSSGVFNSINYEESQWAWYYDVKDLRVYEYPENATKLIYSANRKTPYDVQNPMADHANGDDIHPYCIKLLPVLIY